MAQENSLPKKPVTIPDKGNNSLIPLPLEALHENLGAKMGSFAGWRVPIEYEGVLKEWEYVRNFSGLFDISHMGRVWVLGEGALTFLDRMLTRNLKTLPWGKVAYALLLDETGGILDDVTVYRFGETECFLCVNASHTQLVLDHLRAWAPKGLKIVQAQDYTVQLALQGPKAERAFMNTWKDAESLLRNLPYYAWFKRDFLSKAVLVSRTGYTGEDGFEVYFQDKDHAKEWINRLSMNKGSSFGGMCGFGVRNVLRLEAGYALAGNDFTHKTTPFEAGLEFAIDWNKPDFLGKEALIALQNRGPKDVRAGFISENSRVPREGYGVEVDGLIVGKVTSGTYSPFLKKGIALGYIPKDLPLESLKVSIVGPGHLRIPARTAALPFYPPRTKRKKGA